MFDAFLKNTNVVNVEKFSKKFEKLENPDFFRIKKAYEFFKKYAQLNNPEALEVAMKPKYENMDFDKVHRMIPYAQKIEPYPSDQIRMAVDPKYHKLPFDKIDAIQKKFKITSFLALNELVNPKNENLDWDKVARMIPYAQKIESYPSDKIAMAVDPKYQELPFDSDEFVNNLLHLRFPDLEKLEKAETENLKWDQVLSILSFNKQFPDAERVKMAVDPKYQKWDKSDFQNISSVYDLLEKLRRLDAHGDEWKLCIAERVEKYKKMKKESVALALEPWIQEKGFEIAQADNIFKECKDKPFELSTRLECWKFKTQKFKKSDL